MVAKIIQALLFTLFCAGMSSALTYTVAYRNLAQTFTAQHTFNPSSAGAPFVIGSNAAEVEVTDLRAEKMTSLAANPTNCTTAGQIISGIDASGNAEGCTNVGINEGGGLMRFPHTARTCFVITDGTNSFSSDWGCDQSSSGTASSIAATDSESVTRNFTTSTITNTYGPVSANEIIRTGQVIVFEAKVGMQELAGGINRRVWIGMTSIGQGNPMMNFDNPAAANIAAFRWNSAADTEWQCVVGDTSSTTSTDSGNTVDASLHTFRIELNAAKTTATFKIDGTSVCSLSTTNGDPIPGSVANDNMSWIVKGVNNTGGGASGLRFSHIYISWGSDS